jgi:hypothetical protein
MNMNGDATLSRQATMSVGIYFHIITNGAMGQVSGAKVVNQRLVFLYQSLVISLLVLLWILSGF